MMKKALSTCLIGAMLLAAAFWGCSDKKEPAPEKSATEKMTGEPAEKAVNPIRSPIDKARSAAKQQEEKNKKMDDAVKTVSD
jgi:hypothetical protein